MWFSASNGGIQIFICHAHILCGCTDEPKYVASTCIKTFLIAYGSVSVPAGRGNGSADRFSCHTSCADAMSSHIPAPCSQPRTIQLNKTRKHCDNAASTAKSCNRAFHPHSPPLEHPQIVYRTHWSLLLSASGPKHTFRYYRINAPLWREIIYILSLYFLLPHSILSIVHLQSRPVPSMIPGICIYYKQATSITANQIQISGVLFQAWLRRKASTISIKLNLTGWYLHSTFVFYLFSISIFFNSYSPII